MFVVRADSPYRRIADLLGKPIAWGAQGSGLVILGRYDMDWLGFDAAKDFPVRSISSARATGRRWCSMASLPRCGAAGNRLAGLHGGLPRARRARVSSRPNASEIARILAKHSFLKPVAQPAGSFPGQDAAISSVGS